jgi:hypothetical protein
MGVGAPDRQRPGERLARAGSDHYFIEFRVDTDVDAETLSAPRAAAASCNSAVPSLYSAIR